MVAERNPARDGAELQRVDHVARERRPAADDLVSRIERELGQVVDHPVRAGTGRNLLEPHVVQLCERRAEPPGAAVGIAVQAARLPLDRLQRRRERPERPLVRRELDDALEAELALHLLDRLSGLVWHEILHRRLEERVGDLREAHASTLSRSRPINIASM